METKSNEATPQRPDGDRILDAPVVKMDLDRFIKQLKDEPTWKESERNSITIFKSANFTIVLIGLHEDGVIETHTANSMITLQVLKGKIKVTSQDETEKLEEGQMIAIHEKVPHSVVASKESFVLLTMLVSPGNQNKNL